MRNMSFALTTAQFVAGTKTVTRRLGWRFLRVGDVVQGVEKGQGLKKGEKVKRLGQIRITNLNWEQVRAIALDDVAREGFPNMSKGQFVEFFCRHNRCSHSTVVHRIEFEHLKEDQDQ